MLIKYIILNHKMKKIAILSLLLTLISCSSSKYLEKSDCNENRKFKAQFLKNVQNIEDYTVERTTISSNLKTVKVNAFFKSLNFITKYTKTPYPDVFNLQTGYRSISEFQADKKKWFIWYEQNKCKNLH